MSDEPKTPRSGGLSEEDMMAIGQPDPEDFGDYTDDPMVAADSATPYLAPIDPPVVPGGRDEIEIAQGFAATDEGAEDRPGNIDDDEITARVRDLLRSDAATSMLNLDIDTVDRVVYLRGSVQSIDDADMAAEVAGRIPDVIEVVDETTVQE